MARRFTLNLILALSALAVRPAHAADDWAQLKSGMTSAEAAKQLGEPLIRTTARGYEVWIYDGHGEVLFAGGPVKAWTRAEPSPASAARPIAEDVLIRPVRKFRLPRPPAAPPVEFYREMSATRFRYL